MELRSDVSPLRPDRPANEAPSQPSPPRSKLAATSMLVIVGPLAVLVLAGAILAIASWLFGGQRAEMLIAAGLAGMVAGVLATLLLYRAARERQDAYVRIRSITARVGDIVETAMDPIITIDEAQRIVLFNSAAEKAFGWPRDAV